MQVIDVTYCVVTSVMKGVKRGCAAARAATLTNIDGLLALFRTPVVVTQPVQPTDQRHRAQSEQQDAKRQTVC